MFSKDYDARLERTTLYIQRVKKEERSMCSAVLVYDFTEGLAGAIGGAAPRIYEMMKERGGTASLKGARLQLDTKTVQVVMSAGGDSVCISETSHLTARVQSAQAEGGADGALLVKLSWEMGDGNEVDFLRLHLAENISVRMDRQQLELPLDQPEPEPEPEAKKPIRRKRAKDNGEEVPS